MKKYFLILCSFFSIICNSQKLVINVPENNFGTDDTLSIIVSQIQNINHYENLSDYDEIDITLDECNYSFASKPSNLKYSNSYLIINDSNLNQYTLYLTPLPIVSIESNNTIVDEPKVLANFTYSDTEKTTKSNIGIELRGGYSQSFPKKTYDIEFWKDDIGNERADMQFGELRNDDDWILDALYNEPLRIRSYIANKLWKELHTPYYVDDEPKAKSGADVMYVEMFLNKRYNGIYNLSEQVDKKQLKIKKFNEAMRGELYKSTYWGDANTFNSLPYYNNSNRKWGGYEFKHPDKDQMTDWENLYQFTDFVINSSTSDFAYSIWSKFVKNNFTDYFLFLNLIRATDNTGKNIYLCKYKVDEPYIYVPWDLDACFGTIWTGDNEYITDDILTNGFIDRVIDENPNNTFTSIARKWFDYRKDVFNLNSLSNSITNQYNFLHDNKVYERESLVYANYSFDNHSLLYTLNWLENRLAYLDIYFEDVVSANSITISNEFSIYPNPTINKIHFNSDKELNDEEYKIFNCMGQLESSGSIKNKQINIEKLYKGIYYIIIDEKSFKFIKN